MSTVVVVGASIGGVRTAQALRRQRFAGRIIVVGDDAELPYDKPPLSKQLLAGTWEAGRLALLSAEDAARDGIELALGMAADHLDLAGRRVVLADGTSFAYDTVVIATGASARPSPWSARSGVHVLRTLADSQALRADLARRGSVVVIGGGFIGAEVAATANALGCAVTIVDPLAVPMSRMVGAEVGARLSDLHRRHGVTTRFGVGVESVEGRSGDLTVVLTDGSLLAASTVVVGIGAIPGDAWLAASGLVIDDGVVCDEFCRAVGQNDVYAVGDVARWLHPGHGEQVRVEHWTNAVEQAACVAYNIAHPTSLRAYRPVEYVWSDQYDWKIQIIGRPGGHGEHRLIGDLSGTHARASVLYTDDGDRIVGAVTVNWPRAQVLCRTALAGGARFRDLAEQLESLPTALGGPAASSPAEHENRATGFELPAPVKLSR
jgi:phthalate 3,4-dioxygenase ferredoxin reductase component